MREKLNDAGSILRSLTKNLKKKKNSVIIILEDIDMVGTQISHLFSIVFSNYVKTSPYIC